jgi:hypothetical protein
MVRLSVDQTSRYAREAYLVANIVMESSESICNSIIAGPKICASCNQFQNVSIAVHSRASANRHVKQMQLTRTYASIISCTYTPSPSQDRSKVMFISGNCINIHARLPGYVHRSPFTPGMAVRYPWYPNAPLISTTHSQNCEFEELGIFIQ